MPERRRRLPIERAPHLVAKLPDPGEIVFVWCAECERYISEESRHKCVLSASVIRERDLLRKTKMQQLAARRELIRSIESER